ncbi:MAG: lipopolysaccharide biosynthesis protein [Anaerolineales bacterium]|nr:lipopolysaccharide biosynthesis protein [Anaerolineales bacterium]
MKVIKRFALALPEDPLFRRVLKNSSFLFGSNTISAVLIFLQTIFAVRLLGISSWGLVTTITVFVTNVNRLLGFRMREVVVKRMGQALVEQNRQEAAAVVKATGLVEILVGLITFLVVVILSPWAAVMFAKDALAAPWFTFYGLILLSNLVDETSTGILQTLRRFDYQARIALVQSVITASIIAGSFVLNLRGGEMPFEIAIRNVLLAYMLGKVYQGASMAIIAWREVDAEFGPGWWRVPLRSLPDKRGMFGFMLNTNLHGTVTLFTRDNIPLYMAALLSTTEVGYIKIALTLIAPITMILDPFIWPTYAEITQTIAARDWTATRNLLRRVSLFASGVVAGLGSLLGLAGWWLIPALYGQEATPAYPAMLILLAGYGLGGILQWNRPLLLSLGKPGFPVLVAAVLGGIELFLIFWLVPYFGYLMMVGTLSGYFILTTLVVVWRGLAIIRQRAAIEATP